MIKLTFGMCVRTRSCGSNILFILSFLFFRSTNSFFFLFEFTRKFWLLFCATNAIPKNTSHTNKTFVFYLFASLVWISQPNIFFKHTLNFFHMKIRIFLLFLIENSNIRLFQEGWSTFWLTKKLYVSLRKRFNETRSTFRSRNAQLSTER